MGRRERPTSRSVASAVCGHSILATLFLLSLCPAAVAQAPDGKGLDLNARKGGFAEEYEGFGTGLDLGDDPATRFHEDLQDQQALFERSAADIESAIVRCENDKAARGLKGLQSQVSGQRSQLTELAAQLAAARGQLNKAAVAHVEKMIRLSEKILGGLEAQLTGLWSRFRSRCIGGIQLKREKGLPIAVEEPDWPRLKKLLLPQHIRGLHLEYEIARIYRELRGNHAELVEKGDLDIRVAISHCEVATARKLIARYRALLTKRRREVDAFQKQLDAARAQLDGKSVRDVTRRIENCHAHIAGMEKRLARLTKKLETDCDDPARKKGERLERLHRIRSPAPGPPGLPDVAP